MSSWTHGKFKLDRQSFVCDHGLQFSYVYSIILFLAHSGQSIHYQQMHRVTTIMIAPAHFVNLKSDWCRQHPGTRPQNPGTRRFPPPTLMSSILD